MEAPRQAGSGEGSIPGRELRMMGSSPAPDRMGRLIVWAGAGVSIPPPTRLPSGWSLTTFCIDAACGVEVRERTLEIWSALKHLIDAAEPGLPFFEIPRLETVLGGIGDAEEGAHRSLRFLRGFASFAGAPPNRNHLLLAGMVRRGATVVTTNFDLAIQRAFTELDAGLECRMTRGGGLFRVYQPHPAAGCGPVIHVHGAADDPQALGATVATVKEGLAEPFRAWLHDRLAHGADLVFVGYSASDAFDVTPYFMSRQDGAWPRSTLLFAQHRSDPIPPHVKDMARGFGTFEKLKVETTDFLHALHGADPPDPRGSEFAWKDAFASSLDGFAGDAAQPLLTCALANALGINVDRLDASAFDRARAANPGYAHARYHSVLSLAARGRGAAALEAEHSLLAGQKRGELLGYHYARGHLFRSWALALSLRQILRRGALAGPVDWKPYTSLSVHARIFLQPFLVFPRMRPRAAPLRRRVNALLRVAELLSERDLADVVAVHQVATALRFRLLLGCLRDGTPDAAMETRILTLYAEQSHVGGFVSAYRDFAVARALLLRYAAPAGVRRLVAEAGEFLSRSEAVAKLIGDARGEARARSTRALVARAARAAFARRRRDGE